MRLAAKTAVTSFDQNHGLLPSNLTSTTIGTLITFCLDNSYLEFNGCFYSQDEGGTMESLLKPLLYLHPQILLHPTPTLLTTAAAHSETKIILNNAYDKTLDKIKSAPAHHSLTTGHRIARNNINILKTLSSMIQIPLGPD
ncbi:hypothetical protein ACHWQZ_G019192 [Mnemiopsis leidyi]